MSSDVNALIEYVSNKAAYRTMKALEDKLPTRYFYIMIISGMILILIGMIYMHVKRNEQYEKIIKEVQKSVLRSHEVHDERSGFDGRMTEPKQNYYWNN